MPGSCNACNAEFADDVAQRAHYRSEWHRHNLKRKVAGVPGVSEALFNLRLETLAAEKKAETARMIYTCSLCNKTYTTAKAHAQHLQSKLHLSRADSELDSTAVVRPAPSRVIEDEKQGSGQAAMDTDSSDEWEEVDGGDADIQSLTDEENDRTTSAWNTAQCFFCDAEPDETLEGCVEHMHRVHGFFIPDAEYLKDPHGMLNYLGLKVTKGFMCLYCDDRGKRFQSLEAVRKHMNAKSHCKLRQGEGIAEDELEQFYDFSSSYDKEGGGEIMAVDQESDSLVSLTPGGFELVLKGSSEDGLLSKTIGSREFQRYYRQRPKPVESRNSVIVNVIAARYRSMGLATQQQNTFIRAKETKKIPAVRLEVMRTKLGLKNNVIRNLPKNCTY